MKSSLIAALTLASADIISISNLNEALEAVTPTTLTFVDLDDTLMVPTQFIGHDYWVSQYMQEMAEQGIGAEFVINKWSALRLLSDLKLTQPDTTEFLKKLQNKSLFVMGLTAQGASMIERTSTQLKELGLDLSRRNPLTLNNFAHNLSHGKLGGFYNGIIFASGGDKKGEIANEIIHNHITGNRRFGDADYPFDKIIMIDDNRKNLVKLEAFFTEAQFVSPDRFHGYHYVREDVLEELAAFPKGFGDLQLKMSNLLNGIASDAAVWRAIDEEKNKKLDHLSLRGRVTNDAEAEEVTPLRM